jgi:septum formation protein
LITPRLILASASPARKSLLSRAGLRFDVVVSGVDEDDPSLASLAPAALALTLATRKCEAVVRDLTSDALVIGCDSVLDLDGVAFGKPGNAAAAVERWQAMRGRTGVLHTGHCIIDLSTSQSVQRLASTTVKFADISDAEIVSYVATGEPLHVAGAFTIDSLGAPYIEEIQGDPSCVEGLSLPTFRVMLSELGYPWHLLRDNAQGAE